MKYATSCVCNYHLIPYAIIPDKPAARVRRLNATIRLNYSPFSEAVSEVTVVYIVKARLGYLTPSLFTP